MPNYSFSPALLEKAVSAAASVGSSKGGGASQPKSQFNPLSVLIPLGVQLFDSLFGGNDEEKQRASQERQYDKWLAMIKQLMGSQYRANPMLLDASNNAVLQAVMNNMNRTTNWGWPEGMKIGGGDPLNSAGGMGNNNLLQNLLKSLQGLGQGTGLPAGLPGTGSGNISLPGTIRKRE